MPDNPLHAFADGSAKRMRLDVPTPPPVELPRVEGLLAGAAEVDITPPPGMPKAGHSRNAHDGTGFRTRLRARVVHLRAGTTSIALISTDLLAGSAIVHHLVAERIADDVPLHGIFLGATHTHAGPGQFSGSEFYNEWSANRGGFDPAYTAFLVDQLTAAVKTAVRTRRPARLAHGSTEVWGYTRNRALPAHVRNENVADKRTETQRKYAAINPWLHLLRVDERDGGPLAAFAWFSIHGTGISHSDRSYNADVWAYITAQCATEIEAHTGSRPIVGAVEGTHGDMTPAVRPGMLVFHEAERVGRGIGSAAADLHARLADELEEYVDLAAGLREVPIGAEADGLRLAAPRIGVAKLAGAAENATFVEHIPPFKAGFPRLRPSGPQGAKRVVGSDLIHQRVNPDGDFPQLIPVQYLRFGDLGVLGLPFEITVEAGRRVAAAVEDAAGGTAVVSSLANDHCDYLTTPEEYSAQWYEGASTLFGPGQLEWTAACAARLAGDVVKEGTVADVPAQRRFDFSVHRYYAPATRDDTPRELRGVRFVEATRDEDAHWEQRWTDVPPGDLHWHEPLVRVEAERPDGTWTTVQDDQGWYVGIFQLGAHEYAARWYSPPLGRPVRHRFVLLANAGRPEMAGHPFD